jgi:PAS domain S-box-containing protein
MATSRMVEELEALGRRLAREATPGAAPSGGASGSGAAELAEAIRGLAQAARAADAQHEETAAARDRAELELARYRRLLEQGPDGYVETDHLGMIADANQAAARLLGVPFRFLFGKPLAVFVDQQEIPGLRYRLNHLVPEATVEWSARMQPRQGEPFDALLKVTAFREDRKLVLRWFVRDDSDRRRADELAAAHDFAQEVLASEQAAHARAETARVRLEVLAETSRLLAGSTDAAAALAAVGELIVRRVASIFVADLLDGARLAPAVVTHTDAGRVERLRGVRATVALSSGHPAAQVMSAGHPMLVERVSDDWLAAWAGAEASSAWRDAGLATAAVLPLRTTETTLGVLTFGRRPDEPPYGPDDLSLLADIALRIALALRTAQLFRDLEAEHRRKDEFLAMLAHELRNPLAAMTVALDALDRTGPGDHARLESILARQTRHLARLVNDLVDVSRLRLGSAPLERRPIDLRELAIQSVTTMRAVAEAQDHTISLSVGQPPVPVFGDADRLEQVIANLLDNAIKYTPAGGRIDVSVATEATYAVVRVRDSGIGIVPEFMPRVFDVFSRARAGPDASPSGLGLGLTVVRDIVVQHGGSVEASSGGPGQGSEFVVRVPLDRQEAPAAEADRASGSPRRAILIVEDNGDAREALRILLELHGHRVRTAATGEEGLERVRSARPEVALIDIGLPGIDGYEVARTLRGDPGGERLYLVALTGYGQAVDRERALAAGFDAHLVKPVDVAALQSVLATAGADTRAPAPPPQ